MPKVKWLHGAVIDVGDIVTYIALDNKAAARKLMTQFRESVRAIGRMPGIGRPGRVDGTREFIVQGTRYLIAYRVKDKVVEILAVKHGAQEWPDAF